MLFFSYFLGTYLDLKKNVVLTSLLYHLALFSPLQINKKKMSAFFSVLLNLTNIVLFKKIYLLVAYNIIIKYSKYRITYHHRIFFEIYYNNLLLNHSSTCVYILSFFLFFFLQIIRAISFLLKKYFSTIC